MRIKWYEFLSVKVHPIELANILKLSVLNIRCQTEEFII